MPIEQAGVVSKVVNQRHRTASVKLSGDSSVQSSRAVFWFRSEGLHITKRINTDSPPRCLPCAEKASTIQSALRPARLCATLCAAKI